MKKLSHQSNHQVSHKGNHQLNNPIIEFKPHKKYILIHNPVKNISFDHLEEDEL